MRAFKRAFTRRHRRTEPQPPDPFPSFTRNSRRHIRMPAFVGDFSFPSRRSNAKADLNASTAPDDPVASNDLGNSAFSLPTTQLPPVSDAPAAPAPIFYDMYDQVNAANEGGANRKDGGGDADSMASSQRQNSALHSEDNDLDADDDDTVSLDIAKPPNRLPPPHRRLITERYYRTSPTSRSVRKRLSTPQSFQLRRQYHDAGRLGDHRWQGEYSDDTRHRERDRERDRDHYRDFDMDHRDVARYYSEDDYSRITPDDDTGGGVARPEDAQEAFNALRVKKFNSHSESATRRRHRRIQATHSAARYRSIAESPYFLEALASTAAPDNEIDSRMYNAYTESVQRESRGNGGGLRTIVELLRDSEGNPIVIEKAALVIGILSEKDAASRDAFGQFAAVQTLIQCLSMRVSAKFDRTLIVKTVTFALASLLRDSPKNLRLFEMFDGPYKMGKAAASERYENIPEIPRNALRALSELKYHPHSCEGVTNHVLTNSSSTSRTITYVLRALALHEYRTEIQERGLDALRTLLSRSGRAAIDTKLLEQCTQATATAFKMHQESPEIHWQCLSLFCDLDALQHDMFSMNMDMECFFGAMQSTTADLRQHGRNQKPEVTNSLITVLKRAIEIAGKVGWSSRPLMEEAVEAGGVEAMLDALDFFGDDNQVSDKICSVLRVLLQSEEGRARMNRVKSACAILDGIANSNERAAVTLSS